MFDGKTYDPDLDGWRLTDQGRKVWGVVVDGAWHTLHELSRLTGCPEASISARLRDFRKERFGGHAVMRRRVGQGGTWMYRVVPAAPIRNKPTWLPFGGAA